jgi:hypothetical protein
VNDLSNIVPEIIAFENGEMNDEQTIAFFQKLIDTGLVWKFQGSYGRTARDLIENGHCTMPKKEENS